MNEAVTAAIGIVGLSMGGTVLIFALWVTVHDWVRAKLEKTSKSG